MQKSDQLTLDYELTEQKSVKGGRLALLDFLVPDELLWTTHLLENVSTSGSR
jgi:hypothetical protein